LPGLTFEDPVYQTANPILPVQTNLAFLKYFLFYAPYMPLPKQVLFVLLVIDVWGPPIGQVRAGQGRASRGIIFFLGNKGLNVDFEGDLGLLGGF
jgi:hypothetical protein